MLNNHKFDMERVITFEYKGKTMHFEVECLSVENKIKSRVIRGGLGEEEVYVEDQMATITGRFVPENVWEQRPNPIESEYEKGFEHAVRNCTAAIEKQIASESNPDRKLGKQVALDTVKSYQGFHAKK